MPASGSSIFTDADSYQSCLHGMLDLLIVRPDEFRARLTWVDLKTIRLLRARETSKRIATVTLAPRRVFITFPTQRDSLLIYDGIALNFGDFMLHSPGEHMHQRTISASQWGSICLTPLSLETFTKTVAGRLITRRLSAGFIRHFQPTGASFCVCTHRPVASRKRT
jgi:hypothetical protein